MALFAAVQSILAASDPRAKLAAVHALHTAWRASTVTLDRDEPIDLLDQPARPDLPRLIPPQQVPKRGMGTPEGRAALLHALAHIEFNAIHLALDASVRFRAMPIDYYADWLGVAAEEAKHFGLLADSLERRGFHYGSFDAHNGLWEMAARTAGDSLARMALVPRIFEARGLDVTPGIIKRFTAIGDRDAVAILEIILADEIGHVAIGNRWYHWLCTVRGVDPDTTFAALARLHRAPRPHRPMNRPARLAGGFTAAELDQLDQLDQLDATP